MSITKESELIGMQKVSQAVAMTLHAMIQHARVGMSTMALDIFGGELLSQFGAQSAPLATYRFPGFTCISVNEEFCHGIPSKNKIMQEGDLVNIDVSAELNGFWSDNGCSFVLGQDVHQKKHLVDASKTILKKAITKIRAGIRISDIGFLIEKEARKRGYGVIKDLAGHGVGRSLHEAPDNLLNYRDRFDRRRFKKNSVIALETFISTKSTRSEILEDGWTLVGNRRGYVAQHEHTIIVTDKQPIILTAENGIWN